MSDYQRITSYLYEYRNGNRGENVGFIRVETRDQQLKISFTLNIATALPKLQLYFYYYSHGKMIGISWDEITKISPHYEYKESFSIHTIFNHTPLLTDMDGVLLYDSNSHFYGSQWSENPINLHVFEMPSKAIQDPKISKTPSLDEYMQALALHESMTEEPKKETKDLKSVVEKKEQQVEATLAQPKIKEKETSSLQESENELKTQQLEQENQTASALKSSNFSAPPLGTTELYGTCLSSAVLEKESLKATIPEQKKTELEEQKEEVASYPQIYPYPTPDYSSCIKLTIEQMKDFSCIPKELSGNGFLKMQVQNYGHLFLGEQKLTNCHYIGIPGIFTNQRNFVAHLFGFPDFVTVPHEEQKTGNFGYWVMTIDH